MFLRGNENESGSIFRCFPSSRIMISPKAEQPIVILRALCWRDFGRAVNMGPKTTPKTYRSRFRSSTDQVAHPAASITIYTIRLFSGQYLHRNFYSSQVLLQLKIDLMRALLSSNAWSEKLNTNLPRQELCQVVLVAFTTSKEAVVETVWSFAPSNAPSEQDECARSQRSTKFSQLQTATSRKWRHWEFVAQTTMLPRNIVQKAGCWTVKRKDKFSHDQLYEIVTRKSKIYMHRTANKSRVLFSVSCVRNNAYVSTTISTTNGVRRDTWSKF